MARTSASCERDAVSWASARDKLGLGLRVVEPSQDVALLDAHALLDHDLGDLAGDLRRHGRLAPSRHVAARVEDRTRPLPRGTRHRDLHRRWRRPGREPEQAGGHEHDDEGQGAQHPTAYPGTARGGSIDPELLQQLGLVRLSRVSHLLQCAMGLERLATERSRRSSAPGVKHGDRRVATRSPPAASRRRRRTQLGPLMMSGPSRLLEVVAQRDRRW